MAAGERSMVEESSRELTLKDDANVDQRNSELSGNEMPTDDVKENHDLGDKEDKEVIFVDDIDSAPEDSLNGCNGKVKVDEKAPLIGMRFKTYDDALQFYKQYALDAGFGSIILKSSYSKSGICRRLVLGCNRAGNGRVNASYMSRESAKINCPARISLKLRTDRWLHIDSVMLDHNHTVSQSAAQLVNCSKKLAGAKRRDAALRITGRRNFPSTENENGNFTEIGRLKFGEGDDEYIHKFFASMQNKNPNFYYLVNFDQHGCLRNIFWSDARSRAAHEYFGHDVVYFDTSFLIERYDLPLVFFVGMNNHGQPVLFATGLLSELSIQSFAWLFRAFLTCMRGCYPEAIITDHCDFVESAVREVFPQARHRFCLFRVMKDITEGLKGLPEFKEIKKALKKAIYECYKPSDFEDEWNKIIQQRGLQENEWLCALYTNRHMWVPAYLKDKFWAGMSISQHGESITSFFDGFVYPKTSLKQFFSKHEIVLESKYKKELQADAESSHRTPLTLTKFFMEEQLAKAYTINMFRKFQDELKATMYCDAILTKVDGSLITFEVKECPYMEDGKMTECRTHEVYFCKNELIVECVCGSFEFTGILCRHALSVFKFEEVFEIPPRYVLDRWKRSYKKLYALANFSDEMLIDGVVERYDYLFTHCLQLLNLGFISEGRYLVALKLLKDAEKALLYDGLCSERQSNYLPFETQSIENGQSLLCAHLSEGAKNSQSSNAKRRGRPPKKGRASNMETIIRPNKEQDFLRSSFVTNEDTMIQAAPSASHLESHMSVQGIDLMEDIAPNDLSFGTHFGMDVSHQSEVPIQQRIQPNNFLQVPSDHQSMAANQSRMWVQYMMQDDMMRTPGRRTG